MDSNQINIAYHESSLATLQPTVWVNDDIIMAFTSAIQKLYNGEIEFRHRYHYMDTLFMTKLAKDGVMSAYQYFEVRTWTRKVSGRNIFNLDKVFVPINCNNSHWSCIIIDMIRKTITMRSINNRVAVILFIIIHDT